MSSADRRSSGVHASSSTVQRGLKENPCTSSPTQAGCRRERSRQTRCVPLNPDHDLEPQYAHPDDAVLLVLASHEYDPSDYIRNDDEFSKIAKVQRDHQ